jgi:hypothetical protein
MRLLFDQFTLVVGLNHLEHAGHRVLDRIEANHLLQFLVCLAFLHDVGRVRTNEILFGQQKVIWVLAFAAFHPQPTSLALMYVSEHILQSTGVAKAWTAATTTKATNSDTACLKR